MNRDILAQVPRDLKGKYRYGHLAELVRNAHPDPVWVQSSEEVYEKLCEFMNVLNTNVGLYEVWIFIALRTHKDPEMSCRYCATSSQMRKS